MYSIDSMYYAMADGVVKSSEAQVADRWIVSAALWLARQQIFNETDYWLAVAAKAYSMLDPDEQEDMATQFSKAEDAALASPGEWPEISGNLQSVIDRWAPETSGEVDLDKLKAKAVIKIDRSAETYRLNFITGGVGQSMAYQQKLEEARAKAANGSIADSEIPHIVAEAAATKMSKADKAQEILDTFHGWQHISALIEAKRMAAKAAVAEAEDADSIKSASEVDWASN